MEEIAKQDIKLEREALQKIVKEVTIELEEMKPVVETKIIELSKYYSFDDESGELTFKINSEELRKECAAKITEARFLKNQGEELRKSVTRKIDAYKTKWMDIEKEIFLPLTKAMEGATGAADYYVRVEDEKAEKLKKAIQLEADKKKQTIELESLFETNYQTGSTRELMTIKMGIMKAWDSLTINDFEDRIKALQGYKPKVNIDSYNSWFKKELEPSDFLDEKEILAIRAKLQLQYSIIDFERFIITEVQKIKEDLLIKKEDKLTQLKELAKKNTIEQAVEVQKNIQTTQDSIIKEQAAAENKIQAESNEVLESKILVHSITTQAQVQSVKGIDTGVRRAQAVMILPEGVDWNEVIKHYPFKADLDFLLKNLIKVGKPTIKGIKYFTQKKSSTIK